MKKSSYLLIMILVLLASSVTATDKLGFGGKDIPILHVDDCVNMTVQVEGTEVINNSEYTLLNCTEITPNIWECICNGSTDLVLQTKYNTINNYTFTINYTYTQTTTPPSGGSGGSSSSSGSGSHYTYNNTNATFYVNPALQYVTEPKPVVRPATPEPTPITEPTTSDDNNETVVEEPVIQEPIKIEPVTEPLDTTSIFRTIGIVGGISICLLGLLGLIIWAVFFREKKKQPEVIVEQKQDIDEEYNNMMNSLK